MDSTTQKADPKGKRRRGDQGEGEARRVRRRLMMKRSMRDMQSLHRQ
jgi:hypothetical protein